MGVAAGIIATVASGGNLLVGFQAFSFFDSAITSIQTGNVGAFIGGVAGSLAFGALGKGLAISMGAAMGGFANTFAGGFAMGAVEFGMTGFGGGFGAALGGGASLSDSLRAGGMGAAIGGAIGGVVQGSYMAGWQNSLHGASKAEVLVKMAEIAQTTGDFTKVLGFLKTAGEGFNRSWAASYTKSLHEYNYKPLTKDFGKMLRANDLFPIDVLRDSSSKIASLNLNITKWSFSENWVSDPLSIEKYEVWQMTENRMLSHYFPQLTSEALETVW